MKLRKETTLVRLEATNEGRRSTYDDFTTRLLNHDGWDRNGGPDVQRAGCEGSENNSRW